MGAGGYSGVLLVKDPGNVEHRNALPGQVGRTAESVAASAAWWWAPQASSERARSSALWALTLGSDGDAHLRRKASRWRGEQRQRLPPVHEGSGPLFAKPPGPSGVTLGQGGPGRFVGRPQPRAFQNQAPPVANWDGALRFRRRCGRPWNSRRAPARHRPERPGARWPPPGRTPLRGRQAGRAPLPRCPQHSCHLPRLPVSFSPSPAPSQLDSLRSPLPSYKSGA